MLNGYSSIKLLVFSLLFIVAKCSIAQTTAKKLNNGNPVTEVAMSTDAGLDMYQKWMNQAFSGLFSALAAKNLKTLSDERQVDLEECTKKAKNVIKHAKCLKRMFENRGDTKETMAHLPPTPKYQEKAVDNNNGKWVGGFRVKRQSDLNVKKVENYNLLSKYSGLTPIGMVASTINKAVANSKNKTIQTSWQETVEHIRRSALERKKARTDMNKRVNEDKTLTNMELLAFRTINQKNKQNNQFEDAIEDPSKLMKIAEDNRLDANNEPVDRLTNLVRDGVKLGFRLSNKNMTDKELEEKTLKFVSPRFLSVVPDNETDTLNFISPSLFSLHDKGNGVENLTSLPNLLHEFSGRDQQEWLNLIMEAAGIDDQAKNLEKETTEIHKIKHIEDYEKETRDKEGRPLYFTKQNLTDMYGDPEKQKVEVFERLIKSYTPKQMNEMNSTGYTIMNKRQLRMLYGEQDSPYHHNQTFHRLSGLSKSVIHERVEEDIKTISQMDKFEMRQKDIALSPIFFTPLIGASTTLSNLFIVLSPLVFSPIILSPAVLGPIILSPWVFIPLILSPRVLGPLILSPMIFSPVVLSPLVLHPLILTPGIFNPIILSPLVLSPLILSPQVFSPLVLSPLVLNPLILNPGVGFPLVLSPFLLSPLILSPQALFGLILSPYVLSPVIESKLIEALVVLSPSFLS